MSCDVSVASCSAYSAEACRTALEQVLAPLGGLDWVRPGMRIAVKANLVSFLKPEAAATTHPALLRALTELLRARGASVVIGDSPGGLYTAAFVGRVYAAAGLREAEAAGAALNQNFAQRTAEYPQGTVCRRFPFTAWLDDADAVINFCKLKTHGMMALSCAAKNLFGVIPGTKKPEFHFQYANPADFARMIVDLDEFVRPVLSICDAVVGMEGNGPTAGTPRPVGCLAASSSPHLLDLLCAALIGLRRSDVPTLEAALERGLIPESAELLNVVGDWRSFRVPDYHRIEGQSSLLFRGRGGRLGRIRGALIQQAICPHPAVCRPDCIGCGKCREICPAGAVSLRGGFPVIDRRACIHCFCCQEFCPAGAMRQRRPWIARLLNP